MFRSKRRMKTLRSKSSIMNGIRARFGNGSAKRSLFGTLPSGTIRIDEDGSLFTTIFWMPTMFPWLATWRTRSLIPTKSLTSVLIHTSRAVSFHASKAAAPPWTSRDLCIGSLDQPSVGCPSRIACRLRNTLPLSHIIVVFCNARYDLAVGPLTRNGGET